MIVNGTELIVINLFLNNILAFHNLVDHIAYFLRDSNPL